MQKLASDCKRVPMHMTETQPSCTLDAALPMHVVHALAIFPVRLKNCVGTVKNILSMLAKTSRFFWFQNQRGI